MIIVEKYTGEKTYMFPNGALATKEAVLEQFPACLTFTHVIETDENHEVLFAMENLSAMRTHHGIDPSLTEDEAITKFQEILNTPIVHEEVVSPEERTAAALEYQNLMAN